MALPGSSLYDILGVTRSADTAEIKSAFRSLALKYHPDKNRSSAALSRFKVILNAYTVLSDPSARQEYDAYLSSSTAFKAQRSDSGKRHSSPGARSLIVKDTLAVVLDHLNFVLWDIEEIIRSDVDLNARAAKDTVRAYLLMMLTFIDKWVLDTSGHPDYFFQARNMPAPGKQGGASRFPQEGNLSGHRPFVNLEDYFYNIRLRANKLLNSASLIDLGKVISEDGIRVVDCVLETHNYCFHYLGYLHAALHGEQVDIPPFHHSAQCFAPPADA